MQLDVYNTHMELYPYVKGDLPIIENMFTAIDKFSGNEFPCGYMVDDGRLFLPKGAPVSKIERLCDLKANYIKESDEYETMDCKHEALYDPRDKLQEKSIEFLKQDEHQLSLNLLMGLGKAQPISTKIPTSNGNILMGDIKPGNIILDRYYNPTIVTGVFPQGVKDIFKIELWNGRSSMCSAEHLWNIRKMKKGIFLDDKEETISFSRLIRRHYTDYAIPYWDDHYGEERWSQIRSITYSHQEEAQCIMVDNPDHLYITENDIITHNTYCTIKAISDLQIKSIIITPSENIKQQWMYKTLKDIFNYRPKHMCNIAGSNIIDSIMDDLIDPYDIYLVNHQTLQSYSSTNGGYALHKFFKKIKVGIKVYDESHLQFKNILTTDFYSNTNKTIYLSATFDRSDKTESACFKKAFQSVINFGENESFEIVEKHVIYHVVNINSHISPKDRRTVIGFAGMTSVSFGRYAILVDQNKTMYKTILKILEIVKNVEGRILIFIPLIEAVEEVAKCLKKDQDKTVGTYHSKISKDEKEATLKKKDIIISTIGSLGTGQDIDGLRVVINCEPLASKVNTKQVFGRIRPYVDAEGNKKDTYFFDIVDICIPMCNYWFRARFKAIESLAKDIIYLNMDK